MVSEGLVLGKFTIQLTLLITSLLTKTKCIYIFSITYFILVFRKFFTINSLQVNAGSWINSGNSDVELPQNLIRNFILDYFFDLLLCIV